MQIDYQHFDEITRVEGQAAALQYFETVEKVATMFRQLELHAQLEHSPVWWSAVKAAVADWEPVKATGCGGLKGLQTQVSIFCSARAVDNPSS